MRVKLFKCNHLALVLYRLAKDVVAKKQEREIEQTKTKQARTQLAAVRAELHDKVISRQDVTEQRSLTAERLLR